MSPFAAYIRVLILLTAFALLERSLFAFYHSELTAELSHWQTLVTLLQGMRFDLAAASVLSLLSYLVAYALSRLLRWNFLAALRRLAYVAASALVLIHGADLLYFDETGRHLGYEIKEAYSSGGELLRTALTTYAWEVVTQLLLLMLAWGAVYLALPQPTSQERRMFGPDRRWYQGFAPEARLIIVLLASVILARGGLQSVPLEPLHAQALGDPKRAALALNGTYNAVFSAVTPYSVERVLTATPTDEQRALVAAMLRDATPVSVAENPSTPSSNVVMIFLESWSAHRMASYGNSAITTPFFDELRQHSLTTRDMLAGGHRTTEGLFSTLCSAQNPLGATVAQSQLQNYPYRCLPQLLRDRGYHTAFFQGTVSGTSGTGAFTQLLGFEGSYGKEHVTHHSLPHNNWGLHDPDLYAFTLEKLESLPAPFLVGINTNTTHDHLLPPGAPTPFDPNTREGRAGNVLHFADAALGNFVDSLFRRYPDTLLVLVADHTGSGSGPTINRYRIPFLIHSPGRVDPAIVDGMATQRDIAPTLLQLLKLPRAPWFTGQSLVEPGPLRADYYDAGVLGWVEGDQGVELPLRKPESPRCFLPRGEFPTVPCEAPGLEAAKRGLALTTVLQDLLFGGRLAELRSPDVPAP